MQRILIHICCGPCAIYPMKKLLKGEIDIWGFFFNPNIHPYTEYQKRLTAVKTLAEKMDIKMLYRDEYNLEEFLKNTLKTETVTQGFSLENVKPEGLSYNKKARCGCCYSSRLEAAAKAAKENRFDYFS
ncbi:MAG: epoxyqueuosine reductase QueH, partial [Deltaproteobacteria bacterium]|nr:epoxyqueuosine reductase QueH [Deltaproteobacteria bacterium]